MTRSLVPVILAGAALLSKVVGMVFEISDTKGVGDDFDLFMLLLLFVIVASLAYIGSRRMLVTDIGTHAGTSPQDVRTVENASAAATRD